MFITWSFPQESWSGLQETVSPFIKYMKYLRLDYCNAIVQKEFVKQMLMFNFV